MVRIQFLPEHLNSVGVFIYPGPSEIFDFGRQQTYAQAGAKGMRSEVHYNCSHELTKYNRGSVFIDLFYILRDTA